MKNIYFLVLISLVLIFSCSKYEENNPPEPEDPIILIADAGPSQTVEPNELVYLDGSVSTGPDGFTYNWQYKGDIPENSIGFTGKTTAKPTFTPPENGVYYFTLTIAYEDSTDNDEVVIITDGAIEIGGTLTEDLELKNIQPDASLPDYIVTSDLIVPDGLSLSIVEDDVVIKFEAETGIHVKSGGTFTNVNNPQVYEFETELNGDDGWKGILIDGGTINLKQVLIVNAGRTAFTGQSEAAAITLTGDEPVIESFSDNEFANSYSYDILVTGAVNGYRTVLRNQFSFSIPIKAPITFMNTWYSDHPNSYPESYDYIHLIPGGRNVKDIVTDGFTFAYGSSGKYYIDGDFWAGSSIVIGGGCEIFMKEGTGILAEEGFATLGNIGKEVTISGIDGKNWKGIAGILNSRITLRNTTIKNAGHGTINIGGLTAEAPAVVYTDLAENAGGSIVGSRILGSGGYGYYNAPNHVAYMNIEGTLFENTAMAAIRTNVESIEKIFYKADLGNTFENDFDLPMVLVQGDGPSPLVWYPLGESHYYLIDAVVGPPVMGNMTFRDGVILKFKANRYLAWRSDVTSIVIRGTSDNPVIFDSETGQSGSWGGLFLGGNFIIENLIIKNGGGFVLPDATEKANIISAYTNDVTAPSQRLHNTTIANSAGWGIVIENPSVDFDFGDPNKNNTFTNNSSGDIIDLNQ